MKRNKISEPKRRAEIGRRFLTGVALLGLAGATAIGCSGEGDEGVSGSVQPKALGCALDAPELCDDGDGLALTLEGCRISDAPDGFDLEANNFRCDGAIPDIYTTGNIRPGFNELDLVPHRLTIGTTGAFNPDPQMYIVSIGHDSILSKPAGQFQGYDAITVPTLRPTVGCEIVEVGDERVEDVGVGGVDQTIFRDLLITQAAGAECVLDWQARLAVSRDPFLGASAFTGSSLQSQVVAGGGSKTVPIPVAAILPQEIDKDMTATQDTDFAWNITKGPMPAKLDFGDTCDPGNDLEEEVSIQVDWEILPGMPGMVMIVTNISATNPANRSIRVDVSDEIFSGATSLDVLNCDAVDVPANTTQLVCTHVIDAPADVTDLSDTATATYIDVVTGIPVPGQSQAMASAPIQPGTQTNTTAVISDSEVLSGTGLTFTVDSTSGAAVTCNPAVPTDSTTGPVVCATGDQTGDGFVVFNKTVSLDERRITSGTLSDTATLTGSDGFTASASASVMISSNATVALTINKTIPDILQDLETIACNFTVTGPNNFEQLVTIDFGAGQTSESEVLSGLEPGTYMVTEGECGGLVSDSGNTKTAEIVLPSCSGAVSFNNVPGAGFAVAEVNKVTKPVGNEDGWNMTLKGPGLPMEGITLTTADNDPTAFEQFAFALQEGNYEITEEVKPGWDQTMVSAGCSFPVDYPADFGQIFQCEFENTQRGKIIVKKETDPDAAPGSFDFSGALTGSIGDGGMLMSDLIPPGSYSVVEDDPTPNFDLVEISCDDGASTTPSVGDVPTRTASFELDPGETVTCTFKNRQRGMVELEKLTNGVPGTMNWNFTLVGTGVNASDSSPPTTVDFDGAKLIPGEEYTLCETGIPAGWTLEWQVDTDGDGVPDTIIPMVAGVNNDSVGPDGYSRVYDPNYVAPPGQFTNDTRCVNFVVDPAETLAFQIDNQFPGGEPRTIGYWKNWNTCTNGNQPQTAAENGGPAEGWFILDDLLNNPGYTIGILQLDGADCEAAVDILDKRDIESGKKKASDAAYGLAAQLLAAQLNLSAGAETCQAAVDAVNAGQALLASIGFDGTGNYLKGKNGNARRAEANALASTLDDYNNGFLCN